MLTPWTLPLLVAPFAMDDGFAVYAQLASDALVVGELHTIEILLEHAEGVTTTDLGIPAPFLQIETPASVKLSGRVLSEHRDLARNEFLQEPWERLLKEEFTELDFTLVSEPAAGEVITLNVTAYAKDAEGHERFVRKRLEIPLEAGGKTRDVAPTRSSWGPAEPFNGIDELLHIGDRAVSVELPRMNGETFSLGDYLGKKNIIVTTYRAFW